MSQLADNACLPVKAADALENPHYQWLQIRENGVVDFIPTNDTKKKEDGEGEREKRNDKRSKKEGA